MLRYAFAIVFLTSLATPVSAETYVPVRDKDAFVALIEGKELRNFLYGVRLNVMENGEIEGDAWGWDITGSWVWQDGYFCRDLAWGGDPIPYNCQLVEARDGARLRFTVDQGAGNSATFRLR